MGFFDNLFRKKNKEEDANKHNDLGFSYDASGNFE